MSPAEMLGISVCRHGSVFVTSLRNALLHGLSFCRPEAFRAPSEIAIKTFALKIRKFLESDDGPTAVEYAVMLALIVVVCLTTIQSLGTNANATFTNVSNALTSAS